jgi:ABC-2 type transport system permease protein/lipopolysaccharide transport system permease protein
MASPGVLKSLWRDICEIVREQSEYRELLFQLTKRDLLLRYKQALMGFGWAVFMPLVNTIIFSVVFMRIAPIEVSVPYPVFVYLGLLTWNFTASALRFSVNALTGNLSLVAKVYCPREVFPLSSVLVTTVDTLVGGLVLIGLMVYYELAPGWAVVYLPVVVLIQLVFTLGIALLLSMANLFYRDVKYLFELVITMWMFATSVLYPTDLAPGVYGTVLHLNPMTAIIDGYRNVLLFGQSPISPHFIWTALGSLVILVGSGLIFHRAEFKFAESV